MVNLTTKSGTNALHGSGWEFNRLSAYTANTYQNDALNNAFLASGGTGALPQPKGTYGGPQNNVPDFARSDRYNDWAIYGQDSYKITPRFTLNYGLRYEHYGVQHNNNQNLDSNFYYGSGSNIFEQVASGQVYTAPNSPIGQLWSPRWGTVGPRVGFAYDVSGDGKTSLR
ncbi:MAG TPA: TonB-dependent receptor, partial [Acidobacteriaceae bacterium]